MPAKKEKQEKKEKPGKLENLDKVNKCEEQVGQEGSKKGKENQTKKDSTRKIKVSIANEKGDTGVKTVKDGALPNPKRDQHQQSKQGQPKKSENKETNKSTGKKDKPSKTPKQNRQDNLRSQDVDGLTRELEVKGILLHPTLIKIGLRMNHGVIAGSTRRCVAMLIAIKQMVHDHVTPLHKDFSRSFEASLDPAIKFLRQCRPLSVSMVNAVRFVKMNLTKIPSGKPEHEAREYMESLIEGYITGEIELAVRAITKDGSSKIDRNGEVILTYGNPLLVKNILHKAHLDGKSFRVIIVDSKPRLLGKELLKILVSWSIQVTYIPINAIAYVMKEVTKVFLGAHAMLANGYVMASLGSSQIALVAQAFNVPVLVCCETFNFSERVHTDSFVFNESGPVDDFFYHDDEKDNKLEALVKSKDEKDESKRKKINILNLFYDITPPDFISMIITEKGFLPCSSVSAVIRKNSGKIQPEFQ